jgi:GAF domain-containing protein
MALAERLGEIGADAGFVGAVSANGLTIEVARVTPFSKSPVRLAFPIGAPYPLAAAIRRGEALFITNNDALACDHPGLVRLRGEDHACATLPLRNAAGSVIGSVNFGFDDPREFGDEDRATIAELVAACEALISEIAERARG